MDREQVRFAADAASMPWTRKRLSLDKVASYAADMQFLRGDTQLGPFAARLVRATLKEFFRQTFEELKWVNGLIPLDSSAPRGALSVDWFDRGQVEPDGNGIVSDDGDDIGFSDITLDVENNRAATVGAGFQYTIQEMEMAQLQGMFSIVQEKAIAAREHMDRSIDRLIRDGTSSLYPSVYRFPGITVFPAITGSWLTATSEEIKADFDRAVSLMRTGTNGVEMPDTALFPLPIWERIRTLQNSVDDRTKVLRVLMDTHPFIRRWDWDIGASGKADVGSTTPNSVLIYRNRPDKLRALWPGQLDIRPPQEKNLAFRVLMRRRYAGLAIPRRKSILRLDGV